MDGGVFLEVRGVGRIVLVVEEGVCEHGITDDDVVAGGVQLVDEKVGKTGFPDS